MRTRWLIFLLSALAIILLLWAPLAAAEESADKGPSAQVRSAFPTSVESMIERRRDLMDRRRERYMDVTTGRRWHRPPWTNAKRDWSDLRNDLMEEAYRQRRDLDEARRDAWGRWNHPRSQWHQDVNDARRDARELSRLYRDEMRNRYFYDGPWNYRPY